MKLTVKNIQAEKYLLSLFITKLAKKEILIPVTNCINKFVSTKCFQDELKVAYIIPVFKLITKIVWF